MFSSNHFLTITVNTKSEDERAQAIGIFNSIGSAGFIIGPTVGGNIREYFGMVGFSICAKITSFLFIINALIARIQICPI